MNPDGIQIFHIADRDGSVICVADHLIFDFLKAPDAFFHQHLPDRRQLECMFHFFGHLVCILCETASGSSQGIGRPEYHRIPDPLCSCQALLHALGDPGWYSWLPKLFAKLFKPLPVLCAPDAVRIRPQ